MQRRGGKAYTMTAFNSYISKKKVGKPGTGPLRAADGEVVHDPKDITELSASIFASVYSTSVPEFPPPHQTFRGHIPELVINTDNVLGCLSRLDSFSSIGPDELHPHYLKTCRSELAHPLKLIFCSSLTTGILLTVWKKSLCYSYFQERLTL